MARQRASENVATMDTASILPGDTVIFPVDEAREVTGVESLLAELGGITEEGAKITVYRAAGQNGRKVDSWLMECAPAEFSIEEIARKFGSGDYRIRGMRFDPNLRQRVLFLNRPLSIEAPTGEAAPLQSAALPAPAIDTQALLAGFGQMLTASFQQLAQTLVPLMQRPQENRADIYKEMILLKSLFDSGSNSKALEPSDMVALLQQGVELGKTFSGNGSESDTMLELVKQFGPLLGKLADQQQHVIPVTQQIPVTQNPALPNQQKMPAAVPGAPVAPIPQEENMNMLPLLKNALQTILSAAARDSDPGIYADLIFDQVPEFALRKLIDSPDWLSQLANVNPAVRQHEAWFLELHDAIRDLLTAQPKPDHAEAVQQPNANTNAANADTRIVASDTGRQSGDSGNAQANAPAHARGKKGSASSHTGG